MRKIRINNEYLRKTYDRFNRIVFDNSLPSSHKITLNFGGSKKTSWLGYKNGNISLSFEYKDNKLILQTDSDICIILNKYTKDMPRVWKLTLLHEMTHAWVDIYTPEKPFHGPNFQKKMLEHARSGFFDNLW